MQEFISESTDNTAAAVKGEHKADAKFGVWASARLDTVFMAIARLTTLFMEIAFQGEASMGLAKRSLVLAARRHGWCGSIWRKRQQHRRFWKESSQLRCSGRFRD